MIPPRRIALSGGGMLGVAHIGALEVLQERGYLKCVREYIGTSVGACIAFSLCIGFSLSELRTFVRAFNFTQLQNLDPEFILGFMESFGIDNGENFEKLIGIFLRAKGFSTEITFQELYEKFPDRPALRIFATDISKLSSKEFSLKETPTVTLKFALRASAAIPMIFTPVVDMSGSMFVDGGVITSFPFYNLTPSERHSTIGICFEINKTTVKIENILDYFKQLYFSVYHHQRKIILEEWTHKIIVISPKESSSLRFQAGVEEKEQILEEGRVAAENFLKGNHRIPVRRYSIV
jgi:predicted acylesterase/phospholipase RssA